MYNMMMYRHMQCQSIYTPVHTNKSTNFLVNIFNLPVISQPILEFHRLFWYGTEQLKKTDGSSQVVTRNCDLLYGIVG